jgi:hypothetical protein
MKDGVLKFATADGDEIFPGTDVTAPYFTTLRDALDHWQRGAPAANQRARLRASRTFDRPSIRTRRALKEMTADNSPSRSLVRAYTGARPAALGPELEAKRPVLQSRPEVRVYWSPYSRRLAAS